MWPMHKMMQDLAIKSYAFFKKEEGFLSLSKPSRYIRVTNLFIHDYLKGITLPFSKESFHEILSDTWQVQVLYYELGMLFEWGEVSEEVEVELATFIDFSESCEIKPLKDVDQTTAKPLSIISFKEYEEKFKKTYENLLDGNCYQLNLTSLLKFEVDDLDKLEKTFLCQETFSNLSEFAHLINLEVNDELIISNSPECLYCFKNGRVISRPIKGTVREEQGIESFTGDEKNESELNIITDLLRNDLSRIGDSFSQVDAKREFFRVPGLIHQYSQISVAMDEYDSAKILKAIFPGGSITGAPKKRVLKLIKNIENNSRGIYTGSTVLNFQNMKTSSINIRTLSVSKSSKEALYGAGGGITLLSEAHSEYLELLDKANSFLKVIFKDVKI